eukprot:NODE_235_length_1124_cov_613.900702_g180_i1.p1 GENE.NODE_235_length_1124_cov_613.900702_g180_i1~~NODE_235_length_1124_cov_613.900702_g180_i1.p1  ORF type:complete len:322 (+),score=87.57 NODE_235_length_1124_cov_613.900702_g180_i1:144-968(+)
MCGKVNLIKFPGKDWESDPDCTSGCENFGVSYCKKFFPAATFEVTDYKPVEKKKFETQNCGFYPTEYTGHRESDCCAARSESGDTHGPGNNNDNKEGGSGDVDRRHQNAATPEQARTGGDVGPIKQRTGGQRGQPDPDMPVHSDVHHDMPGSHSGDVGSESRSHGNGDQSGSKSHHGHHHGHHGDHEHHHDDDDDNDKISLHDLLHSFWAWVILAGGFLLGAGAALCWFYLLGGFDTPSQPDVMAQLRWKQMQQPILLTPEDQKALSKCHKTQI